MDVLLERRHALGAMLVQQPAYDSANTIILQG
jgi:hypothetical protein